MKTVTLTQTAISVLFPRKQETSNYEYTFSQSLPADRQTSLRLFENSFLLLFKK